MNKPELLTACDVARAVEPPITPDAVRRAVHSGRLNPAAVTPGGVRLFARDEVLRFDQERARRRAARSAA